jgi:hypothetical protein
MCSIARQCHAASAAKHTSNPVSLTRTGIFFGARRHFVVAIGKQLRRSLKNGRELPASALN